MKFISTKNPNEKVSFKQATMNGLADNKGLYVPEYIPKIDQGFFEDITEIDDIDIAFNAMYPFVKESIVADSLRKILKETLSFSLPVVQIKKNLHVLELFHGPTMAFKDVGARFIARCMSEITNYRKNLKVIVATSGDTGSAVANGFYNVKGVEVFILFPKGKISAFQEHQMSSLWGNIKAIEVDGTFDDCQHLAKQALNDDKLKKYMQLSSANSINVARYLPQMLYYFLAYKQIKQQSHEKNLVISVPSGNFGSLTAGLYAKKMGLPIEKFIAANNINDTFYQYYKTGKYHPKPSVATYSNAMDVGTPSNFERIMHLYKNDHEALQKDLLVSSFSDQDTLDEIKSTYQKDGYILDPHGAIGQLALKEHIKDTQTGIFLATASPHKFESVVKRVIPDFPVNQVDLDNCSKIEMRNDYDMLKEVLK